MSIYRDTYVSIDGEYDKINAAYSYGGPELALRTINRNLDLNITDFATVNFKALADAVDVLGGIPLTINSEKELQNLNDYIGNMNHINGGNSPKFEKPELIPSMVIRLLPTLVSATWKAEITQELTISDLFLKVL